VAANCAEYGVVPLPEEAPREDGGEFLVKDHRECRLFGEHVHAECLRGGDPVAVGKMALTS